MAPPASPHRRPSARSAFTLVELMVACAVLLMVLGILLRATTTTSTLWKSTNQKFEAFSAARTAFDHVSAMLGQAVLNTYLDYDNPAAPTAYVRASELQFLSGPTRSLVASASDAALYPAHALFFLAPTGVVNSPDTYPGLTGLLNAYGYFVQFGDDSTDKPSFLQTTASRYRYRLKQWIQPSEQLSIYAKTSGNPGYQSSDWINLASPAPRTLAENVIALVALPEIPSSTDTPTVLANGSFAYNSRINLGSAAAPSTQYHQLPPQIDLVLVAIDEASAVRLAAVSGSASPNLVPSTLFANPASLNDDLAQLTSQLVSRRVRYVVLRSTVKLRASRWGQNSN